MVSSLRAPHFRTACRRDLPSSRLLVLRLFPHALTPFTPGKARTRSSTLRPPTFNEAGSSSRFPISARAFTPLGFSPAGCPPRLQGSLHDSRCFIMVNTFQLTRGAELSLAHRISPIYTDNTSDRSVLLFMYILSLSVSIRDGMRPIGTEKIWLSKATFWSIVAVCG